MYSMLITIACLSFLKISSAGKCVTPKGTEGNCTSLFNCHTLLNALATLDEVHFRFVKTFQCGQGKPALVCCPTGNDGDTTKIFTPAPSKSTTVVSTKTKTSKNAHDLLPSKRYCGYQHTDDYYVDKYRADPNIDEYPWLGSVLYLNRNNETVILCACTLINDKYCLTAAHCFLNRDGSQAFAVKLGDYNLNTDKDCVSNGQSEDCNDPVVELKIKETIVHPEYSRKTATNDIALLRLNQSVVYSDFIRPICLPLEKMKPFKLGDVLSATAWGYDVSFGKTSTIKKRLSTQWIPNETCASVYYGNSRYNITNQHFCTVWIKKDNCETNSGGPIMISNRTQWSLAGINSFGSACGGDVPDVNTNVFSHIDWIVDNIKA